MAGAAEVLAGVPHGARRVATPRSCRTCAARSWPWLPGSTSSPSRSRRRRPTTSATCACRPPSPNVWSARSCRSPTRGHRCRRGRQLRVRLALRGRRRAGRARRPGRPAPRPRVRALHAGRHDRHGHARAAIARGRRRGRKRRRPAPPRDPRHGAGRTPTPASSWASPGSTPRSAGSADRRSPTAPAATSPPRSSWRCSTTSACTTRHRRRGAHPGRGPRRAAWSAGPCRAASPTPVRALDGGCCCRSAPLCGAGDGRGSLATCRGARRAAASTTRTRSLRTARASSAAPRSASRRSRSTARSPVALLAPGHRARRLPRLAPDPGHPVAGAALRRPALRCRRTGCGAVWLARLTGGQEVGGSNPLSPTRKPRSAGISPASDTCDRSLANPC